jgi:cell division protease FtsH
VLTEHIDQLHRISMILIERETIDKDQFERLIAGESEESVFAEEAPSAPAAAPADEKKRKPEPKARPFPIPGATMQPPPPEGAKG